MRMKMGMKKTNWATKLTGKMASAGMKVVKVKKR